MSVSNYDTFATGGLFIRVSALTSTLSQTLIISKGLGAPGNAAGLVIRSTQSGSVRGRLAVTYTDNDGQYFTGIACMQSQRDVTGSTGQFYGLGLYQNAHVRIYKYASGAANFATATLLGTAAVSTPGGGESVTATWDANASGLGGTRLTVTAAGGTLEIFDFLNPFVTTSGEGILTNDPGTAFAQEIDVGTFTGFSLS